MKKICDLIDDVTYFIGRINLAILVIVIFLQVVARYGLNHSLAWPEEIARFAFLLCTYMGFSTVMSQGKHMRITLLQALLPKSITRVLDIFVDAFCVICLAGCTYLAFEMTIEVKSTEITAVSLPLPMWIIWTFIPIGCACTTVQAVKRFMLTFSGKA